MKLINIVFILILFVPLFAGAQIPAETCEAATVFTGAAPWTAVGSTVGAVDDYYEECTRNHSGGRDEVIAWSPPTSNYYDLSLCQGSTSFDTKLYIYEGSCPAVPNSGLQIACNSDECNNPPFFSGDKVSSLFNVLMNAGTIYYIVVDGQRGMDQGNYTLLVSPAADPPAPVPAETCHDASLYTGAAPWTVVGSTADALDHYNVSCPNLLTGGRDEVIAWSPPLSGLYNLSLCQGSTNFDTKLYVYAGSCPESGSGMLIACNDDSCSNSSIFTTPNISELEVNLVAGNTYFIIVDGNSALDYGNYTLLASLIPPPPPPGPVPAETCSEATVFFAAAPWTVVGSTIDALDNYNQSCPYTTTGGRDVVMAWSPPLSATYKLSLCQGNTNFDTKLYVYEGSCPGSGSGSALACNDDYCSNFPIFSNPWISELVVYLYAGVTYYIVIDGYDGASFGNYTLTVSSSDAIALSGLAVRGGRVYDYSYIPKHNLTPSNFSAVVYNYGGFYNNVQVQMRVYSSSDGFTTPISTVLSNVLPFVSSGSAVVVTGLSAFTPPDTGTYIFEYVVQSPDGTGSTALDDTSFNYLVVDRTSQGRSMVSFGAPTNVIKLLTGPLDIPEYGVVFRYHTSVEAIGAKFSIVINPYDSASQVTANLYRILENNIDSLELVSTGSVPADFGSNEYIVPLSATMTAGDYILALATNHYTIRTADIYTANESGLVRGALLDGIWLEFNSPLWETYSWSNVLLTNEITAGCNSAIPPTDQSHTILSNRVQLNWTPNAGAVGCMVNGKRLPSGPAPSVNVLTAPYNTTNVPFAVAGAGTTWTWRVRCACSISPLVLSPYTAFGDTFSIPTAREGDILDLTLFPNPADNQLMVAFGAQGGEVTMTIVDMLGRIVTTRTEMSVEGANNVSFDVSSLETGNYFLNIEEAGAMQTQSFSVAH